MLRFPPVRVQGVHPGLFLQMGRVHANCNFYQSTPVGPSVVGSAHSQIRHSCSNQALALIDPVTGVLSVRRYFASYGIGHAEGGAGRGDYSVVADAGGDHLPYCEGELHLHLRRTG